MDNYNSRNIETNLNKIGKMIEEEDNAKDRSILSVCHSLTMAIASILDTVDKRHAVYNTMLEAHDTQLKEHADTVLRGETTLANFKWIGSGMLGILLVICGYGYKVIVELKTAVEAHSVIIPRVENVLSDIKRQGIEIREQETDIDKLQNNKVNKAPKYLQ